MGAAPEEEDADEVTMQCHVRGQRRQVAVPPGLRELSSLSISPDRQQDRGRAGTAGGTPGLTETNYLREVVVGHFGAKVVARTRRAARRWSVCYLARTIAMEL